MGVILNPIFGTGQASAGGAADLSNVTNGPLPVADGGTGATTASGARTALGALGTNDQAANSLLLNGFAGNYYRDPSNLSAAVAVNKGGTGATTAAGARTNLGVETALNLAQGRLSASSTDSTAEGTSSTLYYLPFTGNQISLYNGSEWDLHDIGTGLSLDLTTPNLDLDGASIASNAAYDAFVWNDSGTKRIAIKKWTNTTTRATALTRVDGVLVLTGDTGKRFVGSFCTNGSSNCQSTVGKRRISNFYNRVDYVDTTLPTTPTSYTLTGAVSAQEWNAAGAGPYDEFRHVFFECQPADVQFEASAYVGVTSINYDAWVGLDGTTQAGPKQRLSSTGNVCVFGRARLVEGLHTLAAIETTDTGTNAINNVAPSGLGSFAGARAAGQW